MFNCKYDSDKISDADKTVNKIKTCDSKDGFQGPTENFP